MPTRRQFLVLSSTAALTSLLSETPASAAEVAQPYARALMLERFTPARLASRAQKEGRLAREIANAHLAMGHSEAPFARGLYPDPCQARTGVGDIEK